MERQKIYVVQKGSYSCRHIIGVTTDEQRAEEIKRFFSPGEDDYDDEPDITIFEDGALDALIRDGQSGFLIWMNSRGEVLSITERDRWECEYIPRSNILGRSDVESKNRSACAYWYECIAPDVERAVKMAQDAFAQRRAEELEL